MKDVGKTVKSFPTKHVFTTLLLMLLSMMLPKTAWAQNYESTETYDFATYATVGGSVELSSTTYTGITAAYVADKLKANGQTDLNLNGRFAFRSSTGTNRGWILTTASGGLWCVGTNYTPQLAILNLRAGDRVKITFSSSTLKYLKQNTDINNNTTTGVNLTKGSNWNTNIFATNEELTSGSEYIVLQDGDLLLEAGGNTVITKIEIRAIKDAKFSITSTETSSGTPEHSFQFTQNGRMAENVVTVPYMTVEFGNPINTPIVRDNKVEIPDENGWEHLWASDGKPYQGTFYVFKPTASGKLWIKGSLDNTQMELLDYDENGTYKGAVWTGSSTGDVTIGWIDVKKNHVYYLVEGYNFMTTGQNQKWTKFKLAEFKFQNTFTMGTLGLVLENGATRGTLSTLKNSGSLTSWNVRRTYDQTGDKVSDNIDTSELNVTVSGNTLTVSGIKYNDESADKGGVIVLDLNFENGDAIFVVTIPYSAEKGHKWDFYSKVLQIGQYKTAGSQLQQETDNGEWKYTYRVINNQGVGTHDPMYQNVYDMEGDNADMIWETEGLIFNTPAYKSCLYNENNLSATEYTDRYVGILPTGSFTIPGLKQGDRVLIQMGSGDGSSNDVCFFNISNALDAIGQSISSSDTYKAGGSLFNPSGKEDYELRGYYHFIAAADGPMTFYMNGGSMTKIYSIEIYTGTHKHTNDPERQANGSTVTYNGDRYTVSGYQYVHRYNNNNNLWGSYQMHYRGKGDPLRDPTVIYKSGNVTTTSSNLFWGTITNANGNTSHHIFFKSVKGEHGMFRMRVDVMEQNNKYVADYGLQNICVGYIDKQAYPYTWDFTDLMKYSYTDSNDLIKKERSTCEAYNKPEEFMDYTMTESGGFPADQADVKAIDQWKWYNAETNQPAGYGLQVRNSGFNGELAYPSESQLYAGDEFIAEAVGIDIQPYTTLDSKRNGHLRITDQGLSLYQRSSSEFWTIKIPEVSTDAAVYVRAKSITKNRTPRWDKNTVTYSGRSNDGDYIFAVKGTGGDVVIKIGDAIIQKIAVSTDAKKVNKLGYATESRNKEIDPELMGYMTGTGLKAYTVTSVEYSGNAGDIPSIKLTAVPSTNVIGAATQYDHNAYIIYNTDAAVKPEGATEETKAVNALDDGFHLFVPDMHDVSTMGENAKKKVLDTSESGSTFKNHLRSWLPGDPANDVLPPTFGDYTNYVLSSKGTNVYTGQTETDVERFRRIAANVKPGNNKAFLPLLTDEVKPKDGAGAKGMFAIVFVDEEEGTETTSLDGVKSTETLSGDNAIYTLSGVKVSKPQKGIFIKNGKKIVIK